jgi:transposase
MPCYLPRTKMNENDLKVLRFYIDAVKVTTQKALSQQFSCHQSTICRTLKRAGITYKKITYQSTEQLRRKNKAKIEEFINMTLPSLFQSQANIFFLDECSFHLNSAPRRGYCAKSSRLVYQRPGIKGKQYTFIFLVQITNGKKVIHRKLIEGGMKSKEFHEFISSFKPPNNGRNNYLIMDNLSVHRARKSCQRLGLTTIEELLRSKSIEPIYLPPYTPELNPVERCFNIIRQYVEKYQARSEEKLKLSIEEKVEFFQEEDMNKYLDSSIKECLMKNNEICSINEKQVENSNYCSWSPLHSTIAHEIAHIGVNYGY